MNTEIIFVLDKSGSMSSIRSAVLSGTNAFVDSQREVAGAARFTLIEFSYPHSIEARCVGTPLESVPPMTVFSPNGGTALYDAIGYALESQGQRIAQEGWADKVIMAIMTDGQENASQRYSREEIHNMIGHAQEHGWDVLFLGANIDVERYREDLGIVAGNAYQFTSNMAGTQAGYATLSTRTAQLRGTIY